MTEITIRRFALDDEDGVIGVIIPIQRQEFAIDVSIDSQPDLRVIADFYQTGNGDFWVAEHEGKIIGTLGLKDIGNRQAALRKMFVAIDKRGGEHQVAKRLLTCLLDHAKAKDLTDIFLGTTTRFLAAHRFYEKNGFQEIVYADLPRSFPLMKVDSKFYRYRF